MNWIELESQLVAYIRERVPMARQVEALPQLDGAQLLGLIGAQSPGVYLEFTEFQFSQDRATLSASLLIVVRHAGGQGASRQAEQGLWALIQQLLAIMPLQTADGDCFYAMAGSFNRDSALLQQSIAAANITIKGELAFPSPLDEVALAQLADFKTFAAAVDIPPFTPEHHTPWLLDPVTATAPTPTPDSRIHVTLPQE